MVFAVFRIKSMSSKLPRLVLHFDVNGTVIITDPAAGLSFEDAIEKALDQADWINSSTYPPTLKISKTAVTKTQLADALKWPHGEPIVPELCMDGNHHFMFPSFYKAITELACAKREFTIVFRTFGSDIKKVQTAINSYAAGNHPHYKYIDSKELHLPNNRIWVGRYGNGMYPPEGNVQIPSDKTSETSYTMTNLDDKRKVLSCDNDIIEALEIRGKDRATVACTDHYEWWRANKYKPSSGKPLWLSDDDLMTHHIFFDDCIHNSATDSIVSVRRRKTTNEPFSMMTGRDIVLLHGIHTVRVQTTEAILNSNYFLDKIQECELARDHQMQNE